MLQLSHACLVIQNKMTETLLKHATKTTIAMVIFSLIGTGLLAYTFEKTKAPIDASLAIEKMKSFAEILPQSQYDNDLLQDFITVPAGGELNNRAPTQVYVARQAGVATAVLLEATARDGYAGDIRLLIAVYQDGSLGGVRVIQHKETPGLGDYIEVSKDNWIKLFDHISLITHPKEPWKVKKDGGEFAYMTGATITPRAVVKATYRALKFVESNKAQFFAAKVDKRVLPEKSR
jgi:Na+-translocating ferredoxin:NAD+ oxidoreductase subunit G